MFEKYSEYKDSDVKWLGEIPVHWQVLRLKNVCKINQHSLTEETSRDFAFEYVDIGSVSFEKGVLQTENVIFKNAPSRARRIAKLGDTIVSTVRTYLKAIDYVDDIKSGFIYSTGFAILGPSNIYPKFLTMAIRSNSFTDQVDIFSTGMSYPAINSTELSRLKIAIPPLAEQTAIANFLDRKTAQIDQAISIKEKQIELLKERRQILIHNAVTRGLDPDVKMKDSGVEWIGEIPEHWKVSRLNHLTKRIGDGLHGTPSYEDGTGYFFINGNNLVNGRIKIDEQTKTVGANEYLRNNKNLNSQTLLLSINGTIGNLAFYRGEKVMLGKSACYLNFDEEVNTQFIFYFLQSSAFKMYYELELSGSTINNLSLHSIGKTPITIPHNNEQKEIVTYLEQALQKLLSITSLKQKEIEKLKEYKSTLINSAVTGKIKVS